MLISPERHTMRYLRDTGKTYELSGEFLKVWEAPGDLTVHVTKNDASCAVKNDPVHCAFANAAHRQYGSQYVDFHLSVAYLLFDADSEHFAMPEKGFLRFTIPHRTRKEIAAFDAGNGFKPGRYPLRAPTPGRTMTAHRTQYKKRMAARHTVGNANDTPRAPFRRMRGGAVAKTLISNTVSSTE